MPLAGPVRAEHGALIAVGQPRDRGRALAVMAGVHGHDEKTAIRQRSQVGSHALLASAGPVERDDDRQAAALRPLPEDENGDDLARLAGEREPLDRVAAVAG